MHNIGTGRFCDKIYSSKYERKSLANRKWWETFFAHLEQNQELESEQKRFLKDVLPFDLYYRLIGKFFADEQKKSKTFVFNKQQSPRINRTNTHSTVITSQNTAKTIAGSKKVTKSPNLKIPAPSKRTKSNPYLNFFKKHTDELPVWHEDFHIPDRLQKRMSKLNDELTEKIACLINELINLIQIDNDDNKMKSRQNADEYLDVGPMREISKTVKVGLKELASVTDDISWAMNMPEKAHRAMLLTAVTQAMKASRTKKNLIAFGRKLPPEVQSPVVDTDTFKSWLNIDHLPTKSITMSSVWEGLTDLESTKGFCRFIYQYCPDLDPPVFLVKSGMMDPNVLFDETS